jgi:hypothetical protein
MRSRRYCWLIGLVVLAACVVPPAVWVFQQVAFAQDRRAAYDLITHLRHRRPPDVDERTWEMASGWAITAYCNVCFSPEHVSHDELRRFRADLEGRLREPVDLATVDWVWDRLGRTGPRGRSYQQRFEPLYRESLEAMRPRR